jgi:hypothetical protein
LPYTLGFLILNQFLMFTFYNLFVNRFSKLSSRLPYYTCFLYFCLLHSWRTVMFWDQWDDHPSPCACDIWWTLDFASAFLSPGVGIRTLGPGLRPERRSAPFARGISHHGHGCVIVSLIFNYWVIIGLNVISIIINAIHA